MSRKAPSSTTTDTSLPCAKSTVEPMGTLDPGASTVTLPLCPEGTATFMPHTVTLTILLRVVDAAILSFKENARSPGDIPRGADVRKQEVLDRFFRVQSDNAQEYNATPPVIAPVSEATKTDALSARATVATYNTISDAPGPTIFGLMPSNLEETGLRWIHTSRS